ncbi:MAG: zinc-dependent metalloprotease [Acidimicrobiia bacterium]
MTTESPQVSGITGRIAGQYPLAGTYHISALQNDMARITPIVSELVADGTGLALTGDPTTSVIDRTEWVERNLASFKHLVEPATRKLAESRDALQMANVDKLVDRESSALLGILSRRVLGQYELVLPTGEDGDSVIYVGPNLLQMERAHQFRPSEFRFWVALHELTHRAQFTGVPWLRDYFRGLVEELVEASGPEPGRFGAVVSEVIERRRKGEPLIDERGVFGLVATPVQTEIVDRVQALMTVLEGHGHVVMDRIGADNLKSQARMSRVLKNRRRDKRTAAFFRITGLEMKVNQYAKGEKFIKTVEREAGWHTVDLAFRGAGSLPTLDEIEDPILWLNRVA